MSRRAPKARLYMDGGGVVTCCTDPAVARDLILAEVADDTPAWWEELETEEERAAVYPLEKAIVTRGRIVHCLPGSDGDSEGWSWQFLPGTGRGSTPAIEWASS